MDAQYLCIHDVQAKSFVSSGGCRNETGMLNNLKKHGTVISAYGYVYEVRVSLLFYLTGM